MNERESIGDERDRERGSNGTLKFFLLPEDFRVQELEKLCHLTTQTHLCQEQQNSGRKRRP